jgi:CheY-like chemotaxis protein
MAKVLVIDDVQMMRLYLRRCLEKGGYEVEDWMPLSAMEIPERIKASAPDLILTDYSMAGCNGATVARMAKKANPELPVVVLSAFMTEDMESGLLKAGVRRVLTKPITPQALVLAVQETLESALPVGV